MLFVGSWKYKRISQEKVKESQTFNNGVWCFLTCRWVQELLSIGLIGTRSWSWRKNVQSSKNNQWGFHSIT